MIDIDPGHLEAARSILKKYFSDEKILVYGSRVKGTSQPFSDIDIAICGKEKISIEKLSFIDDDFSESTIPFRVDITEINRVDESFKKIILAEGVPLYLFP